MLPLLALLALIQAPEARAEVVAPTVAPGAAALEPVRKEGFSYTLYKAVVAALADTNLFDPEGGVQARYVYVPFPSDTLHISISMSVSVTFFHEPSPSKVMKISNNLYRVDLAAYVKQASTLKRLLDTWDRIIDYRSWS